MKSQLTYLINSGKYPNLQTVSFLYPIAARILTFINFYLVTYVTLSTYFDTC